MISLLGLMEGFRITKFTILITIQEVDGSAIVWRHAHPVSTPRTTTIRKTVKIFIRCMDA
jgi:hypothetical protein